MILYYEIWNQYLIYICVITVPAIRDLTRSAPGVRYLHQQADAPQCHLVSKQLVSAWVSVDRVTIYNASSMAQANK